MYRIKKNRLLILCLLFICGLSAIGQQAPEPPTITSVTVKPLPNNPGAVEIVWTDSRVSDGYYIYKYFTNKEIYDNHEIGAGFQLIDSVFYPSNLMCIDYKYAKGHIKSETYHISSFMLESESKYDPSPSSADVSTIFLDSIEYISCDSTNTLKWNPYVGWEDAVYYNIYDGNGNEIEVNWTDTFYTHFIEPGFMYSYIIKAVNSISPSFTSSSNIDSIFTTPIKKPNPNNFYINNISYDGSAANFTINIDNIADLLGHSLQVSNNEEIGFSEAAYKEMEGSESIEFLHTVENQPLFYKVVAIDVCHDTVLETNVAKPIRLIATELTETDVTLEWNQSYIESSEVYTLNITIDGNSDTPLPAAEKLAKFNFQQDLDPENIGEEFCFKVEATETLGYKSVSNLVCISRLPQIEFPNAFTPNGDGINDYFGPFSNFIKNVDISSSLFEFKIIIYDKYGGAIYESDNAFQKWTGVNNRASLKYVPEGAYIYYMWFKSAQGKSYEKSGIINVVYP